MNWTAALKALGALADELPGEKDPWKNPDIFRKTVDRLQQNLERDLQILQDEAGFIFSIADETRSHTKASVRLIRSWALNGQAPSLAALCVFAMEKFNVGDEEYARLPLLAAVLGEIENRLPYHNNMHYRKVVLQMIRLIANHNDIYADTAKHLSGRQICLLLAAACVHDYGHDGRGNTVEGVHERARLELYSFELLEHFMKPLGFDDPVLTGMLRVMLTCTDVSPLNDPRSPMAQMKEAYRYHFLGGKDRVIALNLAPDLKPLELSPTLTMMSLLLHEADIATSAGLDYAVTKYETGLLRLEMGDGVAQPGHVIYFLEKICNRQMLSDAGQRLYAANIARIYALAERDYHSGNDPYPEIMRSDFLLGQSLSDFGGPSTMLN